MRPEIEAIVQLLLDHHADGLTLDELSVELLARSASYAEVEAVIEALEDAGVPLDGPEPSATHDQLVQVLTTARSLTKETGTKPDVDAIAERSGLTPITVRRALRLGRAISGQSSGQRSGQS